MATSSANLIKSIDDRLLANVQVGQDVLYCLIGRLLGIYAKHILPHLLNLAMKNPEAARLRAEWVPRARGDVLEVGIGSGLNLPFYTDRVRSVVGVDPSAELHRMARVQARGLPMDVRLVEQSAERALPVESASIDAIVLTWTLCSIPDAPAALREMLRVLKPGGELIFVEHGLAPDPSVRRWQDRLTPVWKRITGGCHLNREVDTMLASNGFDIAEIRRDYIAGPRPVMFTYRGVAVRGA